MSLTFFREQPAHQSTYHFCSELGPRLTPVALSTQSAEENSSSFVSGSDSIPDQLTHLQIEVEDIRECSLDSSDLSLTTVEGSDYLVRNLSLGTSCIASDERTPCAGSSEIHKPFSYTSSPGHQPNWASKCPFDPVPAAPLNAFCTETGDSEVKYVRKTTSQKQNSNEPHNQNGKSADQQGSDPAKFDTRPLELFSNLLNLKLHSRSVWTRPRSPNHQKDSNCEEEDEGSCNPLDAGSSLRFRAKIRERLSPTYKIPGPDRYVRGADKCVKSQRRVLQNRLSGQISRELAREKMIALEREAKDLEDRLDSLKEEEDQLLRHTRRTLAPAAHSTAAVSIKY
jgi:Basic region leucine zipper